MSTGKTYSTKYLLDNNNNRGSEGQVLISTSEGVNWSDGSDIIGGPYLPLSAGSSYPLTDTLFGTNTSMSGNGTYAGSMNLGNGGGTGEKHLTIGDGSTDSGYRYIDLVGDTTYTDYGFRIIRGNGGANTTSQIVHRGTGDFSIQTTEAANLKFVTSNAERMRITSGGNVGIGTTSPTAKVEVLGVGDNSILKLTRGNAPQYLTFRGYQMASNGNHMLVSADDAKQVWLGHQSSTAEVVVDVGGNVGIGTTSPNAMLDIHKNDDTVYDPSADDGQRSIGATIQLNNNSTVTNTFGQIIYDTDSSGQAVARMVFLDAGTSSSAIAFVTEDANQKGERMRIGSDGAIQFNDYSAGTLVTDASGNITVSSGGGAGGPYLPLSAGLSYPLTDTLYGTKATFGDTNIDVATVTIEGGLAGILDIWRNGTNASYQAIRFRDDTNANTEASIGWASNQLRLNGTSTIVATIGGSEKMRIDSAGNVGIGTTSPVATLHVDGNTQLGRNGNNYPGDPQKTIISGQGIEDAGDGNFYGSYGFLELAANSNYTGSARRYAITNGLDASKFAIIRSDSNMGTMQLGVAGVVPTGAVADFVINNTGNVGIGTDNPDWKLHLNSSAELTPTYQKFTNGTATTGTTLGIDSDGS